MLKFGNKEFRNLEEQVDKNKQDIADLTAGISAAIGYMPTILGVYARFDEIPTGGYNTGDTFLIGSGTPYSVYVYTDKNQWVNVGQFPVAGPKGDKGDLGSVITAAAGGPQVTPESLNDFYIDTITGDWYVASRTVSGSLVYIKSFSLKGEKGDRGERGLAGSMGPAGPTGPQGPQGERGFTGLKGDQGQKGDTGATGPAGNSVTNMSTASFTQDTSDPTIFHNAIDVAYSDGTSTTFTIDTKGIKGDKGDTGATGATGETGAAAGFGQPTIIVDDTTGVPAAEITATGPNTAKIFNFAFSGLKGERGQTGATGATGPQGPQGVQGPIGLTGPQGIQGEVGPIGPTGPQGIQGIQGPQGPTGNGVEDLISVRDKGTPVVTYDTQNGITINSTDQYTYGTDNKTFDVSTEGKIPIIAGDGISINKAADSEKIVIKNNKPYTVYKISYDDYYSKNFPQDLKQALINDPESIGLIILSNDRPLYNNMINYVYSYDKSKIGTESVLDNMQFKGCVYLESGGNTIGLGVSWAWLQPNSDHYYYQITEWHLTAYGNSSNELQTLQVGMIDYKLPTIEANPTTDSTEILSKLTLRDTTYSVFNPTYAQITAINSGITTDKVDTYDGYQTAITEAQTQADKGVSDAAAAKAVADAALPTATFNEFKTTNTAAIEGKQDKLTAGNNINIENNTINAVVDYPVTDVQVNGASVVTDKVANVDLSSYVKNNTAFQMIDISNGALTDEQKELLKTGKYGVIKDTSAWYYRLYPCTKVKSGLSTYDFAGLGSDSSVIKDSETDSVAYKLNIHLAKNPLNDSFNNISELRYDIGFNNSKSYTNKEIELKHIYVNDYKYLIPKVSYIDITISDNSTQGTITYSQLAILEEADYNCIRVNYNEIYRLSNKNNTENIWTYTQDSYNEGGITKYLNLSIITREFTITQNEHKKYYKHTMQLTHGGPEWYSVLLSDISSISAEYTLETIPDGVYPLMDDPMPTTGLTGLYQLNVTTTEGVKNIKIRRHIVDGTSLKIASGDDAPSITGATLTDKVQEI